MHDQGGGYLRRSWGGLVWSWSYTAKSKANTPHVSAIRVGGTWESVHHHHLYIYIREILKFTDLLKDLLSLFSIILGFLWQYMQASLLHDAHHNPHKTRKKKGCPHAFLTRILPSGIGPISFLFLTLFPWLKPKRPKTWSFVHVMNFILISFQVGPSPITNMGLSRRLVWKKVQHLWKVFRPKICISQQDKNVLLCRYVKNLKAVNIFHISIFP